MTRRLGNVSTLDESKIEFSPPLRHLRGSEKLGLCSCVISLPKEEGLDSCPNS